MFLEFLILIALWIIPIILSTAAYRRTSKMLKSDRSYQEWLKVEQAKELPSLTHSCGGMWSPWQLMSTPGRSQQRRTCDSCNFTEEVYV
jgi:hypothetical protein